MNMDTESKLRVLLSLFPHYSPDVLLEVLVSCDGSVEETIKLLRGESCNTKFSPLKSLSTDSNDEILITTNGSRTPDESSFKRNIERSIVEERTGNTSNTSKRTQHVKISEILSSNKRPKTNPISVDQTIILRTKEEIEATLPNIRIYPNFLTKQLSEDVLNSLLSQKMLFKAKQFYIAGNLCTATQKSLLYGSSLDTNYDPVYGSTSIKTVKFPPSLYQCKLFIDNKVNEVLHELYKDNKTKPNYTIWKNWTSDFCVGNYYPSNKSHLDWHSDKLTNIGPLPTIASITFGATRYFRLRRSNPSNSTIYNLPLDNNTLILMLPSTQELFKHCVPTLKDSLIKKSDIAGDVRFNLTFRMMYPYFKESKVYCDICESRMILRRLFKGENIGYYVWMCMSSFKGKDCKGFKYADFNIINGKMKLFTNDKSKATRWLNDDESKIAL